MELLALVDKLDDVVANAKKARLSGGVRVDKQETCAIVSQMRGAIPEELRQADWIAKNRDEMLEEARRETARILEEAREERARLLGREEIEKGAEQRAQQLLDGAGACEREIRFGGENYAGDILARLEAYLTTLRDAVGRGRGRLGERRDDRAVEPGGDPVDREAALVA